MTDLDVRLARRPDVAVPAGEPAAVSSWRSVAVAVAAMVALVALLVAASWLVAAPGAPTPPAAADVAFDRTVDAYAGLGTWVDVFDYAPEYQASGAAPALAPADVGAIAAQGASTLFVQAARNDRPAASGVVAPDVLAALVREAHAAGLRVVAWYSPGFADPAADIERIQAIHDFQLDGEAFDGIALDIEETASVPDATQRTSALLQISDAARRIVGDDALGAIVMPPILLEDVNPQFWPGFPWAALADRYDAFLPMTYWTFRTEASGWRDAGRYTTANVNRLRELVGSDAPIHVIGGVGTDTSVSDYRAFADAIRASTPFGASVFDYRSTPTDGWHELRDLLENGGSFAPVGQGT